MAVVRPDYDFRWRSSQAGRDIIDGVSHVVIAQVPRRPTALRRSAVVRLAVLHHTGVLERRQQRRFAMSHGMNFILANVMWITPAGNRSGRVDVVGRLGLGPTLPHVESRIGREERQGYELGGFGLQVAPGIALLTTRRWRLTAEYKFTFARPHVSVPRGTATTTLRPHHIALGIAAAP